MRKIEIEREKKINVINIAASQQQPVDEIQLTF